MYRREDVLGRDATSVFPTEIAAAAAAERSALAEAVGGQNFITETEVSRSTQPCEIIPVHRSLDILICLLMWFFHVIIIDKIQV